MLSNTNKIPVAMSGLPGPMALAVAEKAEAAEDVHLLSVGLTGPDCGGDFDVKTNRVTLYTPDEQDIFLKCFRAHEGSIVIDYSHPSAVLPNAKFYTDNKIPFILGTTGGDYSEVENLVVSSGTPAIVAPNMALPIVALTAMLDWAKGEFPGVFDDYSLSVHESHQKGKADTSGTAKALISLIQGLGADFTESDLNMCRDPEEQKKKLGIPDEYIAGHAYHTYDIHSKDRTAHFSLGHNILGRSIYAEGTLFAVRFLQERLAAPVTRSYTMIDVLKNLKG
ncbi:MAG: dihydrodipicolinate reductase [Planctomycetes bacterium]|nr:dihydrodipicolinate reductase [Planctomycetota bacterium]